MIRPPDLAIGGTTLTYMSIPSHEAVRRVIDLAFRDCWDALDLTWGSGGFWRNPLPPALSVLTNSLEDCAATYNVDFTDTKLPDSSYDLVIYDPPHLADGGANSIMSARYGTVRGTADLKRLIQQGAAEAWRLARIGLLVKVADHAHGGEMLYLSDWIKQTHSPEMDQPYLVLHTYRSTSLTDGKWKVQRAPRSNGSLYLAFRKDGAKHKDFERLYARQERLVELAS